MTTNSSLLRKAINKGCRVVHLDLETSPHELWAYGLFNQYFTIDQIKEPGKITSVAWMEEGGTCQALGWDWSTKTNKGSDERLLSRISDIINDADIIVGQNVEAFDLKWINWRLNFHGLPPLKTELMVIDTLKLSRKVFRPPSHKLDFRSHAYGYGGKISQTMKQIIAVAQGDEREQAERIRYNVKDVIDERKIMWREFNAYTLPKKLERFLQDYIAEDIPFCRNCAAKHRARYDVRAIIYRNKRGWACNNCDSKWGNK